MLYEYTWPEFKKLNHIRMLSEQQQIKEYYFYLDRLTNERIRQNKGPQQRRSISSGFLLQEDLFLIQQEDGSGIYITSYA